MLLGDPCNLVHLTKTEIKPASELLARAFHNYPLFANFIPAVSERSLLLPYLFQFLIRYSVLYGEVYATSPRLEGIAVCFESEKAKMTLWKMIRVMGFTLIYDYFRAAKLISKLLSYNEYASKLQNRYAHYPHWYLFLIGVDPVFQGRGYVSALIRPIIGRLDREGLPCYLETQDEKNIPIYEHYGFKVVEKGTVPGTELNHWAMLREKT